MNEEADKPKTPKKKKTLLDPRDTLSNSVSGQMHATKEEMSFLNEVLQASMDRYKVVVDRQTKDLKEDVESLHGIVTEYLSDFIIIGHTLDDRRVVLRYAQSAKDYDALRELTREYLTRIVLCEPLDQSEDSRDI